MTGFYKYTIQIGRVLSEDDRRIRTAVTGWFVMETHEQFPTVPSFVDGVENTFVSPAPQGFRFQERAPSTKIGYSWELLVWSKIIKNSSSYFIKMNGP